jgi:hypothetical protein
LVADGAVLAAILRSPAEHVEELLAKPVWKSGAAVYVDWIWKSGVGEYEVTMVTESDDGPARWMKWAPGEDTSDELYETVEAAQSACWHDFVSRVRRMFRGGE